MSLNRFLKFSFAIFAGILISSCNENREPSTSKLINIEVSVIAINDGWGFEIYRDERKIIDQPTIPAILGNIHFKTKEDAQNVGNLMKMKIEKGVFPPAISIKELDSLEILK